MGAQLPNGPLTQDVNKSGKNSQMGKIRFFSLPAHKNLIQYDSVDLTNRGDMFDVWPFEGPYVSESHRS